MTLLNSIKIIKSLALPQRSLSAMAKVRSGYAILKDTHHMWQSVVYRACIVEYAEYAKAYPWGRTQGSKDALIPSITREGGSGALH